MKILRDKSEARRWVMEQRRAQKTIGLVPTMGALHEGHYSLVRRSVARCDLTVATIFVNPTQFAPGEDLSRYPRTLEQDLEGLETNGAAAVFVPEEATMYRPEHSTYVLPPVIAETLEGKMRPEHFRGVTTVVLKLFQILPTTNAFFGQKDYQQAAVISAMVLDLDVDVQIEICPIVRDADGLALSSRNRYLSAEQRIRALGLSRSLAEAERLIESGIRETSLIETAMRDVLFASRVDSVDYAVIVDGTSLQSRQIIQPGCVALVAARVGSTRLIDNWVWKG